MNELKHEKSPYLLQHKNNPVHWKAWGDKAIKLAKDQNKLIFLSIGYATCHWCHVMEHESFESDEVAKALNQNYVAIKVDREELPDVDQIYMDALHAMGQRGGWPLNLFLTPDLLPVYGGTYFPKPNFIRILGQLQNIWESEPIKMKESGEQLRHFLDQQSKMYSPSGGTPSDLSQAFEQGLDNFLQNMTQTFDHEWGGFSEAPKFPPHQQLRLLCHLSQLEENNVLAAQMLGMVDITLKKIAQGGIYDHLGGGLTRYSVDEKWEIPHFEKMLYVNAQAIHNYLDHYQITKQNDSLEVVKDIVDYVERDMSSTGGAFYSAEDADSEGHEGKFYVWSYAELQQLLEPTELTYLEKHFGVTENGNFEGVNNLNVTNAEYWEPKEDPLWPMIRGKLMKIRDQRIRPLLDDKQLTSWNGLMIGALARAGRILGDSKPIKMAERSVMALKENLWKSGKLHRRYRDGQTDFEATLDDYAFLIDGLIELYQSNASWEALAWAIELQQQQDQILSDSGAGYFYTPKNQKHLIVRTKDYADNALPSGNGVSVFNLARLYHLTLDEKYRKAAKDSLANLTEVVEKAPMAYSQALLGYLYLTQDVFQLVSSRHLDVKSLAQIEQSRPLMGLMAYADKKVPDGFLMANKDTNSETYYLCRQGACENPSKNLAELLKLLRTFQTGSQRPTSN